MIENYKVKQKPKSSEKFQRPDVTKSLIKVESRSKKKVLSSGEDILMMGRLLTKSNLEIKRRNETFLGGSSGLSPRSE